MFNIPIKATVNCTDGKAGTSTAVIINPLTQTITHFVVQDKKSAPYIERLVSVELVTDTTPDKISLSCSRAEFADLKVFSELHYIPNESADLEYLEPYITPLDTQYTTVEGENIPPGEMAVRRGAVVEAVDGYIGNVGEFLIDPQSGHITHIVLQKGHLWGKKEMSLPIATIDHMEEMTVLLKLTKDEIADLHVIPVRRTWKDDTAVELIVWSFEGSDTAGKAVKTLKELDKKDVVELLNVAVLTKDEDGKTTLKEAEDLDGKHGALFGAVTGGLIGLLGGPAGVIIGAAAGAAAGGAAAHWVDMGFGDDDLKALRDSLQPDSSAVVLLLEQEMIDEALDALGEWGGHQLQQSLTDKQVAAILSKRPHDDTETAVADDMSEESQGSE